MFNRNRQSLVYLEGSSMHGLYASMEKWQMANDKGFLSLSVQRDGEKFCCIALTNPAEVVITDESGRNFVAIENGRLLITE